MIGDEARRLIDMVEQILTFARTLARSGSTSLQFHEHIVRRHDLWAGLARGGHTCGEVCRVDLPLVAVDENSSSIVCRTLNNA
jgi:hypothetical protein